MQANSINILSTRQLPELLLAKAFENGVTIDVIPFIKTEIIKDKGTVQLVQELAKKKIVAVFTSVNAVDAVITHLTTKPNWDIYCMGGVTKEQVINFFGIDAIKGTARNATNLAEKIVAAGISEGLVFFCSDHRLDKLPVVLKANAVGLQEIIVYQTIETPHIIENNYDAIIFFSPSAVHSFFCENTIATDILLFAIGKTTAATIATYASNEIIASEWPGQEQLIDQVINYYHEIKRENKAVIKKR